MASLGSPICHRRLQHDRALDALAEQLAAILVNSIDIAARVVGIGRAAARTIKPRPAILALGP